MNAQTPTLLLSSIAAAFLVTACDQDRLENGGPFRTRSLKVAEASTEPVWTMESGTTRAEGRYCRGRADIPGGTISLTGFPESESANLTISAPTFADRGTADATVQFDDGTRLRFPESLLSVDQGLTIIIDNGRYFLNDVARAGRLAVTAGERTIAVPLHGRDAMIGELSRCWNNVIEEEQRTRRSQAAT